MTQYHRLNVPIDLWNDVIVRSGEVDFIKPTQYALNLLRGTTILPTTHKPPPKIGSAAPEEKIKKLTPRTGKKFLFWDPGTDTTGWYYLKDNEDIYNTFFYWCEKHNYLTADTYGPLFVSGDVDITEELKDLAKLMGMARDAYLKKLNVPRPKAEKKDFSEYDAAVDKRNEDMDRIKESK